MRFDSIDGLLKAQSGLPVGREPDTVSETGRVTRGMFQPSRSYAVLVLVCSDLGVRGGEGPVEDRRSAGDPEEGHGQGFLECPCHGCICVWLLCSIGRPSRKLSKGEQ